MPIDLQRFNNFKDAELRSLEVVSPTHIKMDIALQDSARAFDWIALELDFYGVKDAKLIEQNQLKFIDMSEGLTLLQQNNEFAFASGACYNISNIKNATFYIISEDFKYQEKQF